MHYKCAESEFLVQILASRLCPLVLQSVFPLVQLIECSQFARMIHQATRLERNYTKKSVIKISRESEIKCYIFLRSQTVYSSNCVTESW